MLDRLGGIWEHVAPWVVALLLVTTVGAVWGGVYLAKADLNSQNNHHAQTQAQQKEIIHLLKLHTATLKEIASLRTEVTTLSDKDGPVLVAGQNALIAKLDWIECDTATPGQCGPRP